MTSVKLSYGQELTRNRQHERAVRSTQVLESFASGFTLRPVSVKLVQNSPAPAFSSSNRIWIDETQLTDLTTALGVTNIKGLTIHEIAHILLTPRSGAEISQWVMEQGLHKAYNALEDQRIESYLLVTYPSIKPWLEATIHEYLLKTSQQLALSFPLIRGRKYLDARVRKLAMALYPHQQNVAELSSIIDQYRTLNMTDADDVEIAKGLIERYAELTKGVDLPDPNGHDKRTVNEHETNVKSRPWSKKQQSSAKKKFEDEQYEDEDDVDVQDIIDQMWQDELEDAQPDEQDKPDTNTSKSSQDEESDDEDYDGDEDWSDTDLDGWDSDDEDYEDDGESSESDSNGAPEDQSGDLPAETSGEPLGDASADQTPEQSSQSDADEGGTGASTGESPVEKALKELLQKNLDETLERLADKIANDIALYNGDVLLEGEPVPTPPEYERVQRDQSVSPEAVVASEEFAFALQQLRAEHAPAWNRRVAEGRINAARWVQGCDFEEAFDRYEEGRDDATDIECVVLLDVSGSMSGMITEAHESMWAIKHALDSIRATTSVVAYSDGSHASYTLYDGNEQVEETMRVIPDLYGTDPNKALQYAKYLLANSQRAIKLLIVITDGQWQGKVVESEETIMDIRNGGVITALAYLSSCNVRTIDNHGCEIASHVTKPADLFDLGQAIVEVGIQRQLTH